MSKIYAKTDDGRRFLVEIECDRCDAKIKPGPDIAESGWTRQGWDNGPGTEKTEIDLCPEHSQEVRR